ncbi:hypothetical protein [Aeromicrobium sp.]|uniref:hypothetical protein n=1 Tax=Aeromicrobium sp. TaxID=1871063 RepID=UPI0030BED96E
MTLDQLGQLAEIVVDDVRQRFWVDSIGKCCEADNVREEHCDLAALRLVDRGVAQLDSRHDRARGVAANERALAGYGLLAEEPGAQVTLVGERHRRPNEER